MECPDVACSDSDWHHELIHLEVEEDNERELNWWSLSIDSKTAKTVSSSRRLHSLRQTTRTTTTITTTTMTRTTTTLTTTTIKH